MVGFLALGAYGLYNVIDYYRKKAKAEQRSQANVADLKQKQESLETKFYGFVNQIRKRGM
jgi:phosphoserine aminotransferase